MRMSRREPFGRRKHCKNKWSLWDPTARDYFRPLSYADIGVHAGSRIHANVFNNLSQAQGDGWPWPIRWTYYLIRRDRPDIAALFLGGFRGIWRHHLTCVYGSLDMDSRNSCLRDGLMIDIGGPSDHAVLRMMVLMIYRFFPKSGKARWSKSPSDKMCR